MITKMKELKTKKTGKIFKTVICTIAMVAATSACTSQKSNSEAQQAETIATDSDSLALNLAATAGTYEGTIPSADGPGQKVVLTINADSTYSWSTDAIGKEKFHDEASGVYNVLPGNVLMLIRPSSNEHTFYKVKDTKSIIMTDSLGNEPDRATAKFYVLTKK
jgi:copper homeostasis protein (lipoprotein)